MELKKCPKCEGDDICIEIKDIILPRYSIYSIYCGKCNYNNWFYYISKQSAIKHWNETELIEKEIQKMYKEEENEF